MAAGDYCPHQELSCHPGAQMGDKWAERLRNPDVDIEKITGRFASARRRLLPVRQQRIRNGPPCVLRGLRKTTDGMPLVHR
jgi:hypothetical protein